MTSSTSNYRRQLRNDLLVITTLVVAHQPNAPIIESGTTFVVVSYCLVINFFRGEYFQYFGSLFTKVSNSFCRLGNYFPTKVFIQFSVVRIHK